LFTASNTDVSHDTVLVILHRTLLNLQPEYDSEGREDHTTVEDEEDIEMEEDSDGSMTIAQSRLGLNQ
jgi:hypothetical protein